MKNSFNGWTVEPHEDGSVSVNDGHETVRAICMEDAAYGVAYVTAAQGDTDYRTAVTVYTLFGPGMFATGEDAVHDNGGGKWHDASFRTVLQDVQDETDVQRIIE